MIQKIESFLKNSNIYLNFCFKAQIFNFSVFQKCSKAIQFFLNVENFKTIGLMCSRYSSFVEKKTVCTNVFVLKILNDCDEAYLIINCPYKILHTIYAMDLQKGEYEIIELLSTLSLVFNPNHKHTIQNRDVGDCRFS